MGVDKERIKEIVEVFYQGPFKVFNVNSEDGIEFTTVTGAFISLGLTVPLEEIAQIRDIFNHTKNYKARIAELKSVKFYGSFINSIMDKPENEIDVYTLDYPKNSFNKEETEKLVEFLVTEYKEGTSNRPQAEIIKEVQRIRELQQQLSSLDGWKDSVIFKNPEGEYKIFRKKSSYRQTEDGTVSYRIGIYVEED